MRGFLGRFMAGGMAVAGAQSRAAKSAPPPANIPEHGKPLPAHSGNIAIWSGLMLIPIVTATGFASDRELQIGPRLRDAVAHILYLPETGAPSRS